MKGTTASGGKYLNMGSGFDYRKGWLNVDVSPKSNPDIVADIRELPFTDNSFEKIYCHHVLEHIEGSLHKIMEELWRVLKPNGELEIHVPHFAFHGAICDPEHIKRFDIHTFQHYTPRMLDDPKSILVSPPRCRFEITYREYRYRETDHTNTRLNPFKMGVIRIINYFATIIWIFLTERCAIGWAVVRK